MNTATFRTLMETMGIEQAWIADQLDVGIRSVARWTSPRYEFVPKEAEAWIEDWWDRFQDLVHAAVEGTLELADEQGTEPRTVELSRYASEASIIRAGEELSWPMHSALVRLVAAALAGEGFTVNVTWRTEEVA